MIWKLILYLSFDLNNLSISIFIIVLCMMIILNYGKVIVDFG